MKLNIPNLDPRLQIYYDKAIENSQGLLAYDTPEEVGVAFYSGYFVALHKVIQDLNEAAMGAAFDSIVNKLNES